MTSQRFDEFLERMKADITNGQAAVPMLVAFSGESEFRLPLPYSPDKTIIYARAFLLAVNATRYFFFAESWRALTSKEDFKAGNLPPVSERDDKIECIVGLDKSYTGTPRMVCVDVIREETGIRFKNFAVEGQEAMAGRFADLLVPEAKLGEVSDRERRMLMETLQVLGVVKGNNLH